MTNEPSPRPWRVDKFDASLVRDADGRFIARADAADAALVIAAVNLHEYVIEHNRLNAEKVCELFDERDRLLDIVRRLADRFCDFRFDEEDAAILREARAALGAGETPTGKGVGR